MEDEKITGYKGTQNRFRSMKTEEIRESLVKDMEMLRDYQWVPEPNDDSIDCHIDLIEELSRRAK